MQAVEKLAYFDLKSEQKFVAYEICDNCYITFNFFLFLSYSVDVNSIACHSFYKKLMVDVRKLYNLIQSDTAQDHSVSFTTEAN